MGNDWNRGRGRSRGRGGRRPASMRLPGRGGGGPAPKPSTGPPPEEALELRVLGIGADFLAHFDELIGMPITITHIRACLVAVGVAQQQRPPDTSPRRSLVHGRKGGLLGGARSRQR